MRTRNTQTDQVINGALAEQLRIIHQYQAGSTGGALLIQVADDELHQHRVVGTALSGHAKPL